MSYSIILPTFNENNHIVDLIKSISNIFIKQNILFEILVIDDSSTDGTKETVENFSKANSMKMDFSIFERIFKPWYDFNGRIFY